MQPSGCGPCSPDRAQEVRDWFRALSDDAGCDVAALFGVGAPGLRFADFRSPTELRRRWGARRGGAPAPGDDCIAPGELAGRVAAGRRRLVAGARPPTPPPRRGACPSGGGGDDVAAACARVRRLGTEVHEACVLSLDASRAGAAARARAEGDLVGLLGDDAFDAVVTLLGSTDACIDNLMEELQATYQSADAGDAAGPAITHGFAVTYEAERRARRQEQHLLRSGAAAGYARQHAALRRLADARAAARRREDGLARGGGPAALRDTMSKLGAGAVFDQRPGYATVTIPPLPRPAAPEHSELFPVADLPGWARRAFPPHITHLNRVQSRVVHAAFFGSGNLLVSAPTGAGKTNCALLCMLRELSRHVGADGSVRGAEFKIVYVAPMKALVHEMAAAFAERLAPCGVAARELTGDAQPTRAELARTHLIVTTPEKWDVVTRKGAANAALLDATRLVIFDEVHLLGEDRGAVVEVLVSRLRRAQAARRQARLVGLSATLPNPLDVGDFLGCDQDSGVFRFDAAFRPVPLLQTFVGVQEKARSVATALKKDAEGPGPAASRDQTWLYNKLCFDHCVQALRDGKQVMIFVHSRKKTSAVAMEMHKMAVQRGIGALFTPAATEPGVRAQVGSCGSPEMQMLYDAGFGIHHAGLPKQQRHLAERMFAAGAIRVLCSTSTLAWGVNLPAHTVIIHGTQLYSPEKGFTHIGISDVLQIFGRAGRPQFDSSGHGVLLTSDQQLSRYVAALTHTAPIESRLPAKLADHLNAEIVLGNVTSQEEAWYWLQSTYLYLRMQKNPVAYGLGPGALRTDPHLQGAALRLIDGACAALRDAGMADGAAAAGLRATATGRIASHFYIGMETITRWTRDPGRFAPGRSVAGPAAAAALIAEAAEFDQMQVRAEELPELAELLAGCGGAVGVPRDERAALRAAAGGAGGAALERIDAAAKVRALVAAHVDRAAVTTPSLQSDAAHVGDNAGRICRALLEIATTRGDAASAACLSGVAEAIERGGVRRHGGRAARY